MTKAFLVTMLAVLLAAGHLVAKPGAYVVVSPTPTHVGDVVTFAGCGYGSRPKDIYLELYGPSGVYGALATHTDGSTGCFSATFGQGLTEAGWYEVYVFPDRSKGDGGGTYQLNHALVEFDFEVR